MEKCIPYRAWHYLENIGDWLNAEVIKYVSNAYPRFVNNQENHLLAIGSIFFMADPNSHIWGSGLIDESDQEINLDSNRIYALRGKKTADLLTQRKIGLKDVAFGDPSIFLPEIVGQKTDEKAGKIVIIPHHSNVRFFMEKYSGEEIKILDPTTISLSFVDEISTSEFVISESLHGLILGSAFKKKISWINAGAQNPFKYNDWLSTTDSTDLQNFSPEMPIDEILKESRKVHSMVDKNHLLSVFPHNLSYYREGNYVNFIQARKKRFIVHLIDSVSYTSTFHPFERALNLQNLRGRLLKNWDEEIYFIGVSPDGAPYPSDLQTSSIIRDLNYHKIMQFAVIKSRSEAISRGLPIIQIDEHISWCDNYESDIYSIVIRPFYEESISSDFITYVI